MVYGFVVAHDAETMMTYFVPATKIFESIYRQCGLIDLPLQDFFGLEGSQVDARDRESDPSSKTGAPVRRFEQPASDSIFQMFMDKLRLHTTRNVDQQQYILTPSLEEWFLVKANPNASHLDLLLDFVYAQKIIVPVDADKVSDGSQKCLLVFSILLQIGHGDLIDKFQERGLIDSRLPFERAQVVDTIVQMGVQDAQEIAQQFSEKQWAYLPMIFQYGARLVCPPQMIVPIHQKQRINTKGGIATLWHIVVLEAFVDQALREVASNARYDDPSDHLGYRYQFALKSFKAGQQSLFDSERSAFRAFSNVEGTVRQLCDYIHGAEDSHGMYNIVLEYAELDLDEYFFSKDPPLLSTDIAIFWRRMFDIASAVANIHQFAKLRAGVVEAYSGVHGDIKPDNILWVQETFKLADPGFARFEKSGRAMGPPLGGTKTYGIPYGSPEQGNAGHTDTQASQAIDIWSLGCVLSMAATWVVLGSSGIQRFDQIRVKGRERALLETSGHLDDPNEKAALERGNSFHDDRKVLPEVREWHTNLRCFTRRSDDITASVLDLLDNSVLVAHPSSRINAKDLGALMVKAITTAVSKSRRNQQSTPMLQYGLPLPEASVDFMQDRSKAARKQIVSAPRHYDSVSTPKGDQRATSPSPRSSSSSSSITAEDFSSEPRPFGEHSSTIKVWPRPPVTSYPNPTAIHQEIITHHRHIDHGFERAPESPQRQPQLRGRSPLSVRDGDTGFSQKSSSRRQSTKRASLHQTVPQVLEEMSKSKKTGLSHLSVRGRAPRKDDILSRYIPNRVFSFLVDNAESMNEHWEEATTLLSALIYKTKGIDKDGVDLGFTTGSVQLHNCKTSKKLVEVMKTMGAMPRPGLHTDMNRSLAIILSSYLQRLKKTSSSTTLKDIERGFTLIVLTDGAWTDTQQQQDAIDRTILGFSRSLREIQGYSLVQRPVSIEFIRFGKDERANKSLKRLDFEPKDQDMCDIIDTTPANGNVWKMLLGSIMEEYDNQETDVEEATSISKRPLKISDASNRKSKWIPEEPETAPSSAVRPF
ncbi:uncharacterized protein KY384_009180 [Bacidia gigantensis]|uniref:uncharacterized protein n=1 Tax=Bacidia gigantensis TaxID=2732470 RepID=UPI001D046111|nr:uncharacterized protein KY384_009180 [Bacidia gigantensis]KAG8525536.1 hypothetical protein KY384_009180 [Bacidia gigantensis]